MFRIFSFSLIILARAAFSQPCTCDASSFKAGGTIPVEIVENNVFVPVILSEGSKCTSVEFILDTGANRTIIVADTAQLLGLPVVNRATLRAPNGPQDSVNVQIGCILLGGHRFENVEATVQDTRPYS